MAVITVSENTEIAVDNIYLVDTAGIILTLPTIPLVNENHCGRQVTIKDISGKCSVWNTLVHTGDVKVLIENYTCTGFMDVNYTCWTLVNDGKNWWAV